MKENTHVQAIPQNVLTETQTNKKQVKIDNGFLDLKMPIVDLKTGISVFLASNSGVRTSKSVFQTRNLEFGTRKTELKIPVMLFKTQMPELRTRISKLGTSNRSWKTGNQGYGRIKSI
jgi:hypothetical protein